LFDNAAKQKCPASPGNKLCGGVNGNLLEHLEGILDIIKEIVNQRLK